MQSRHRIPVVFSIYMVDVLCGALGCVILLWQLYHYESSETQKQLEEKSTAEVVANKEIERLMGELTLLKSDLEDNKNQRVRITVELDKMRKERDQALNLALVRKNDYDKLKESLAAVKTERDKLKELMAAAEATIALLRTNVKDLEKKSTLTAEELAAKIKAHAGLLDRLAEAEKKLSYLTKNLAMRESDVKAATKTAEERADLLKRLEEQLALLRGQNKDYLARLDAFDIRVKMLEKDIGSGKKTLIESDKRYLDLLLAHEKLSMKHMVSIKDLADARTIIAGLQEDQKSLIRKNRDFQAAIDNRFEGIKLTGNKVIFLVDMSGSMELIDENTAEPDKWPLVCETVGRLMQSLSDLQQYQVILFSDRARYAVGNDGKWLSYKGKETAKATVAALKAIKPKNETNMYDAFAEAFKFKEQGLDTIYVLSDGLPNAGEGLPANSQNLTETQRTEILSKVVRNRLKAVWNRPGAGQEKIHINTIGFFFESPDVGAFLWALARENAGSFVGMSRP